MCMEKIPYTYLIGWSAEDIWYYGCRYSKNCNPKEFWISYHTSSKVVMETRKRIGEPDVIQIRKTFIDGGACRRWEERVIRRMNCVRSVRWLNRGNAGSEWNTEGKRNSHTFLPGKGHPFYGKIPWNLGIQSLPEKELLRRSERFSGEGNPNYGKKHSKASLDKIRLARNSKNPNGRHVTPHTEESKQKMRAVALKQAAAGNMSAKIRLCCVFCKRETNIPALKKSHSKCGFEPLTVYTDCSC